VLGDQWVTTIITAAEVNKTGILISRGPMALSSTWLTQESYLGRSGGGKKENTFHCPALLAVILRGESHGISFSYVPNLYVVVAVLKKSGPIS
jgi:hypothetical protein